MFGRHDSQRPALHRYVGEWQQIHRVRVGAVHAEILDFTRIHPARGPAAMCVGAEAVEQHHALTQSSGFDLNAREHVVFLDDEFVALIFAEWDRHAIPCCHQREHHSQFGDIAFAFRIALFAAAHTRFHAAIVASSRAIRMALCSWVLRAKIPPHVRISTVRLAIFHSGGPTSSYSSVPRSVNVPDWLEYVIVHGSFTVAVSPERSISSVPS